MRQYGKTSGKMGRINNLAKRNDTLLNSTLTRKKKRAHHANTFKVRQTKKQLNIFIGIYTAAICLPKSKASTTTTATETFV